MGDSKRILVIDDDETLVGPIKEYLETAGFEVAVAFDGMQGVLQAHAVNPDLILLDFNMPAGGGATVYERLRNANDTCRIPIIFTTGVGLEEVKGRIRPSPHTYFLKKPVSLTQIGMVLGQVLGIKVEHPEGGTAAPPKAAEPPKPAPAEPPKPSPFDHLKPAEAAKPAEPPKRELPRSDTRAPVVPRRDDGRPKPAFEPPRPFGAPPPAAAPLPRPDLLGPGPQGAPAPRPAAPPAPLKSEPGEGRFHEFEVRVTYADTDKMGVIYYANYFRYFELGRTELLRSLGVRYRDLEVDRKLYLPIVEARCQYIGPSRYDDLLIVRTWLSWMGPASVCFQYEIYDRESADRLVARGFSRHAVVNERWRPTKIPADLRGLLAPYIRAA